MRSADPASGAAADAPGPATGADPDHVSADGTWLELAVAADLEAVEAVSEILARHSGGATSVEPGFRLVEEGLGHEIDASRPAIVRAYLPGADTGAARSVADAVRRDLGHLQAFGLRPIGELSVSVVHESDWAEAWKEHFPVLRLGRRTVVRPTWRRVRRKPGEVVVSLDPGMAFGTGLHPTTRLCLEGIERWADAGHLPGSGGLAKDGTARVLDAGCGSGILAIAAALHGATEVVGVDIDPIAIEATESNARRNRIVATIEARRASVPTGDPRGFDLVAANLISSLQIALAEALRAELRPGGRLLASGIFVDREADVTAAFEAAGLHVVGRWAEGDWIALEAVLEGRSA